MNSNLPLRKDYKIFPHQTDRLQRAKILAQMKLITLVDKYYKTCSHCRHDNIFDKSTLLRNKISCHNCGRQISLSGSKRLIIIDNLNLKTITNYLTGIIKEKFRTVIFDKERTLWTVNIGNKIVTIAILDCSKINFLVSYKNGQGAFFIVLDTEFHNSDIHDFNRFQYEDFQAIIQNPEILLHKIEELASHFTQNYSLQLIKQFDHFLSHISWQRFEKFVLKLLHELREQRRLEQFFAFLNDRKYTMINSKVVPIGGSGQVDFITINLLCYLQDGFRAPNYGEVKKWVKSKFTFAEYSKAIRHGSGRRTLFFIASPSIQTEVWVDVDKTFREEDDYKYVIIDKDLMLMLIHVARLEHLIAHATSLS